MVITKKRFIFLAFLLFELATSSPADFSSISNPGWCLVPNEYCPEDKFTEFRCRVPAGWSCGDGPRAITETVTEITTLCPQDGSLAEVEQRDPVRMYTMTMDKDLEKAIIDPELRFKSVTDPSSPFTTAAMQDFGGYEYMTYPDFQLGTTIITTAMTPQQQKNTQNPVSSTDNNEMHFACPAAKPILEVSCVDRSRLLWNDFKITWGPAWNDQTGCQRLYQEMNKRGLVTGFHCAQIADQESNTWLMEGRGHRPRFPTSLVADAIQATFSDDNTIYYRGYDKRMLCERANAGGFFGRL